MIKTNRPTSRPRSGFTLIEVLAVIVILTAVASIATVGLASAGAEADLMRAVSRWRELDSKARVLAIRTPGRRAVLRLSAGNTLILDEVATSSIGSGLRLGFIVERQRVETIGYDGRGASPDYVFDVETTSETLQWRCHGLTGWVERLSASPGETRP